MHRPPATRFLIANAGHARWVQRGEHGFATLSEIRPIRTHQPISGRATVHEPAGVGRHGAGEVDLAERRREDFADELAAEINREAATDAFQRLALVAPVRLLAALDLRLSREANRKLVHQIGKDLTKTPDHELGTWLTGPDLA